MTDLVQIEVTVKLAASSRLPPSKPGDMHWVTAGVAQELIDTNTCRYVRGGNVSATPEEGPAQRSKGWPIDRFSVVERKWSGQPAVIIGGGPSVTPEVVNSIRGRARVIAINNSYLLAPWADLVYFADADWWEWHTAGIATAGLAKEEVAKRFAEFAGQKVSIFGTGMRIKDPRVHMMRISERRRGLSSNPRELVTGGNSGYQSINFAWLAGADPILLLGYDMSYANNGKKTHWHGGHPARYAEQAYFDYAKKFASIVDDLKGTRVINCTPGSRLEAFPRGEIESILSHTRAAMV